MTDYFLKYLAMVKQTECHEEIKLCALAYTLGGPCVGVSQTPNACSIFIKYSQDKTVRLPDRKLDFPRSVEEDTQV